MAVLYSYDTLADLLAVDVTTVENESPRIVANDSWYQYDSTATTGGYEPDVGAGRWFRLSGVGLSEIKTSTFTATSFGDYVVNSATNITPTFPTPVDGTSISFLTVNAGRVNIPFGTTVNGLYRADAYLIKDKPVKLIYAGSTLGWVCPTTDVFNGIAQGLLAFWNFGTGGSGSLVSSVGSYTLADTGTTPITYTTGIIGAWALNFDNATADYQVSQSSADLSPTTIPFTDTLGFAFLVNLTSGTEPIISQKWTATSDYTFCVRAIDSTTIEFSVTTGGTGAGTFAATATVTAAYGVDLLIIVTMPVAYTVKSPRDISIQVGDSAGLGSVVRTVITGDFQTSDDFIIGQTEGGSQIVGVVDQVRAYNFELDSNQRNLLWNNGAFI